MQNVPETTKQVLVAPATEPQTATTLPQTTVPGGQAQIKSQIDKKVFILFDTAFLLRVGLAYVFTYAAANFYLNPEAALHYIPPFASALIPIPMETFLHLFEVYEIILAVWLLTGKFSQYAGLFAAMTLIGITGMNLESFSVVFRNVAIIFSAIALSTLHLNEE